MAWGNTPRIASRLSTAPRGEPGRLTTRAVPTDPARARESAANGVDSSPVAIIRWVKPGCLLVEHRSCGFGSHVPRAQSGSSSCQDQAVAPLGVLNGCDDLFLLVRNHTSADIESSVGEN